MSWKILAIMGVLLLVIFIAILFYSGGIKGNFYGTILVGYPLFQKYTDVERVLEETIPGRSYTIKYYLKNPNPDLTHSLYIEYVDSQLDFKNLAKFDDGNKGEFQLLSQVLCDNTQLRYELGYKSIMFRVNSSNCFWGYCSGRYVSETLFCK